MAKKTSIWRNHPEKEFLEKELIKLRAFNPKLSIEELTGKFNELYGKEYNMTITVGSVRQKLVALGRKAKVIKEKWTEKPELQIYFMYLVSFFPNEKLEWYAEQMNQTFPIIKEQYGPFYSYEIQVRKDSLISKGHIPKLDSLTIDIISEKEQELADADETLKILLQSEQKLHKADNQLRLLKKGRKIALETWNLQDTITSRIEQVVVPFPLAEAPKVVIPKQKGKTRESAVLLLSDIHFDEQVSSEETQGLGVYDIETAIRRLQHLSDSVISITKKQLRSYDLSTLHVFGLGDFVSGTIHEDLQTTSRLDIVSQSYGLAFVLAQMLSEWCQVFPHVKMTVIPGNHPRLTEKVVYKQRYANWDYNCGLFLRQMMINQPNCIVEVPRSFIDYQAVEGHVFALMHGQDIRMQGVMPYYGIQRAVYQLESIRGGKFRELFREIKHEYHEAGLDNPDIVLDAEKIKISKTLLKRLIPGAEKYLVDYVCMGHFHDAATLLNEKILLNGSVIGPNEFALAKFLGGVPMQRLFGVHREIGKTWEFSLKLNTADKENKKIRYKLPPEIESILRGE